MLLEKCCEIFPRKVGEQPRKPWQMEESQQTVADMWTARRLAREAAIRYLLIENASDLFRAWHQQCRFQKLHTHFHKEGKQRRRQLYLEQIEIAERAAKAGKQRELYEVIRRLAPQQERRKVQLRGNNNNILTSAQEPRNLTDFCQDLFLSKAPAITVPHHHEPVSIDAKEIQQTLSLLKPMKSAPRQLAPTSAWKYLSHLLAPHLAEIFHRSISTGTLPELWTHAWITWLPKPGKPPNKPENLRPMALQDCGGKSIAKALQQRLSPWINEMVWQQPQFAYTPGRLLEVAVLRAVHHCQMVKEVLRAQQRNVREKKKGLEATTSAGGAILALDMSQAFDRVDRHQLRTSLEQSNLPQALVGLITQWHNGIAYHLRSANKTSCVRCGRGLRQGCPMSPTLWNAITSRVMTLLEQRLGQEWVRQNSTFFADDILGKWVFHSVADLKFMLRAIDALFTVLEEFGMKINSLKSALIIDVRGHSGKQWLRARARYLEGKPHFYAKTESGRLLSIPIHTETKYLGTIISFGNFATKATVRYRIQQAETQRRRLQRILQGKHTLNLSQRLRLWRTCVWTSLQHGLHAVGLGRDELKSIRSCCARHLRAIASCPVHITHDSTTLLQQRFDSPAPAAI